MSGGVASPAPGRVCGVHVIDELTGALGEAEDDDVTPLLIFEVAIHHAEVIVVGPAVWVTGI